MASDIVTVNAVEEIRYTLFKCTLPTASMELKSGRKIYFVDNRAWCENEDDQKELEQEVKRGNPFIYIDPAEPFLKKDELPLPLSALTAKIRAELEAEMRAATNPANDSGKYGLEKALQGVANTTTVKVASGNSNSPVA